MFLQEPNIDRNYVPGKIRNTWKESLFCHVLSPKLYDFKGNIYELDSYAIHARWTEAIKWYQTYEEKMHSSNTFCLYF